MLPEHHDTGSPSDGARMMAALWATGCLLTSVSAVLSSSRGGHRGVLTAIAFAAGAGAVVLWAGQRRVRTGALHVAVVAGLTLIGACILGAGRQAGPAFGFALVWVGCYCALFFPWRQVAGYIGYATAVQTATLLRLGLGSATALQVVMQVGVTTVAAFIVGSLVARTRALASVDPLTGLANRRGVEAALERELATARRSGVPLAVIALDLDRFKAVNDAHGHEAGDRLLQRLSMVWASQLREVDTLGRLGGDEFVVVLPANDGPAAGVVAERLTRSAGPVASTPPAVGASAGVAVALAGDRPADLLRRADRALYRAKHRLEARGDDDSVLDSR